MLAIIRCRIKELQDNMQQRVGWVFDAPEAK